MPVDIEGPMSTSMFADLGDSNRRTYGASYRSVAFGTWKVGESRKFMAEKRRHRTPEPSRNNCQQDKSTTNLINETPTNLHYKSQPKLSTKDQELIKFDQKFESSKSQPCTPITTKRPLKKQPRLAKQEEEMPPIVGQQNGDCYSSTEYVKFSEARNAYENVLIGPNLPLLKRQSLLLNRSMDALNERIVHYTNGPLYDLNSQYNEHPQNYLQNQQPGTSSGRQSQNDMARGTLGRNWRVRAPIAMHREYVVDPGPLYSTSGYNSAVVDNGKHQRFRAKSLDNTNRISTSTLPNKIKRASSKQPEDLASKSALQSAKNFLRRIYNTSTLRLRGRNSKVDAEHRFQIAMAPFYEKRSRPDFNERPFLPYNIRYEIADEEDEGAVYDSHVLSTPASSTGSATTTANHSPDEGIDGMFSTGEETSSSTRSSAVSSTNGLISASARSPLNNSCQYHHRPGSGLSSSTMASSSGLNSTFSSNYNPDNVYNIMSPRKQAPLMVEKFRNWNELFEHLKKEMTEIRARDNQILQDLKKIEEEVNIVKQTTAI